MVVGGGLVGTATAYHLACDGVRTALVDARHPGRATDAGAGILSSDTFTGDRAWVGLARAAGRHYETLVGELAATGQTDHGYTVCGEVYLATRPQDLPSFEEITGGLLASASPDAGLGEIAPEVAVTRFPALTPPLRALWVPRAARVDGRRMNSALLEAARGAGLDVLTGTVDDIAIDDAGGSRRFRAIGVEGRPLHADALVVAGGAWTPAVSDRLGVKLPISPLRGQIVHLGLEGTETADWPVVHQVLGQYMVAWPGGRVAVGATFEDAGFDPRPTAGGLLEVLGEALRVAPGLAGATFMEVRVGLRPLSADWMPILGPVPGVAGAWVATGHGANGLLLGPVSGRLVADLVQGREPTAQVDLWAFAPERFTRHER